MSIKLRAEFSDCHDYDEVEKKLIADGWIFRGMNGSHGKWQNPKTNKCVIIPCGHGKSPNGKGILRAIIRQIALASSVILTIWYVACNFVI